MFAQTLRKRLLQEDLSSVAAKTNKWAIPETLKLPREVPGLPGLKILSPEEQLEIMIEIRTGRDLDVEKEAERICDKCYDGLYGDKVCENDHSNVSGPLMDWVPIYVCLSDSDDPARIFVCANPKSPKWGCIGLDNYDSHGRRGFDVCTESLDEILAQFKVLYDIFALQTELRQKMKYASSRECERMCEESGFDEIIYCPLTTLRSQKNFETYFG